MSTILQEVNNMASIKTSLQFDPEQFIRPIQQLNQDPRIKLAIHNAFAKRCDPYVPFQHGPLSQTLDITAEGVAYKSIYARYQYYGEVYGPNIPIKQDGVIVGWFSPPGQKKHPTGRMMNHSTEYHPLATSFWDKAMMRDHGDEFKEEVKEIIKGEWLHGR